MSDKSIIEWTDATWNPTPLPYRKGLRLARIKGEDPTGWPDDIRVREFPKMMALSLGVLRRVLAASDVSQSERSRRTQR